MGNEVRCYAGGLVRRLTVFGLVLATVAAFPLAPVAAATTYFVGTPGDGTATVIDCATQTNTDCTLRDALAAATSGSDTVTFGTRFPSGTQTIAIAANGTINITTSVTLTGPMGQTVAIDGGCTVVSGYCASGGVEIFHVNGGFTISNLTIQHGHATGSFQAGDGGGIFIGRSNSLTVSNCTFTANAAAGSGGAIYGDSSTHSTSATISITGSTFTNNTATSGGGAVAAFDHLLTVTNSIFTGNTAPGDSGGAIDASQSHVTGTSTITGGSFANNSAAQGGAIYDAFDALNVTSTTFTGNSATVNGDVNARGGAICLSGTDLTVTGGSFTNNTTANLSTTSLFSAVGGAIELHATASFQNIDTPSTAAIKGATFTGNTATMGYPGYAGAGGAIDSTGASARITGASDVTNTLAVSQSTFTGNQAGDGGAVAVSDTTTTITASTFSGNHGPTGTIATGGAFASANTDADTRITETIINSTFTGNGASREGGGLYADNATALTLINSTLDANSAPATKGGDIYQNVTCCNSSPPAGTGTMTLLNTLVGGSASTGGDLANDGTPSAAFTGSYNLIDDAASAGPFINGTNGNKVGVPAGVGVLGNNGGPTQTIPLLPGSAAIGAASASVCAAAPPNGAGGVDQRGSPRGASACSIGAYEPQAVPNPQPTLHTPAPTVITHPQPEPGRHASAPTVLPTPVPQPARH